MATQQQRWTRAHPRFEWYTLDGSIFGPARYFVKRLCAESRSVLLHCYEKWSLHGHDDRRLIAFNHLCLRGIARTGWSDQISNVQLRNPVAGAGSENIPPKLIKLRRLHWLAAFPYGQP